MVKHVKRNAIAYVALFVALGGTSYAAVRLPAGSVGTKELHSGAVTRAKLHRNAVTSLTVRNHVLKAVDFAPGQLKAGPKGDPGPKGDHGDKGETGPTLGVAGLDTGCCPSQTPTAAATAASTKKVTLTTRSRLYVIGSTRVGISGCPATCILTWGLRVDGTPVAGSTRTLYLDVPSGRDTLTPFGVTEPLEPGTHTIELVREPAAGAPGGTSFGYQHIAAVALGA
jgi:hypothetical protein